MKTTVQLDYQAILANTARPVHLVLQFDAPAVLDQRTRPVAFTLVIDRSGSMEGAPLETAKRAAGTVIQNREMCCRATRIRTGSSSLSVPLSRIRRPRGRFR
jgi:Ca-activated chloride channel family protein